MLLLVLVGASCGDEVKTPPSLLLITVETLRADHLGCYGSPRQLTPNLDRLAGESEVFEVAYAPAPFTVPSISTVLTGRYPEQNGIYSNESALAAKEPR